MNEESGEAAAAAAAPRELSDDDWRAATENEVRGGEYSNANGRDITNGDPDPDTSVEEKPIPSWMGDLPLPSNNINNNDNNSFRGKIPSRIIKNRNLLEQLVDNEVVLFGNAVNIGDWEYLHKRLMWLNKNRHLLIRLYARGAYTSGLNWNNRVRPILEEIPTIKNWFKMLEISYVIKHGWVLCYTTQGRHPFHPDGQYRGEIRLILTLGANGKWMWFRNGETDDIEDMVAAHIDHGMTAYMTKEGGGELGVQHGAFGDSEGSWFIGLELDGRDDDEFRERLRIFREEQSGNV